MWNEIYQINNFLRYQINLLHNSIIIIHYSNCDPTVNSHKPQALISLAVAVEEDDKWEREEIVKNQKQLMIKRGSIQVITYTDRNGAILVILHVINVWVT